MKVISLPELAITKNGQSLRQYEQLILVIMFESMTLTQKEFDQKVENTLSYMGYEYARWWEKPVMRWSVIQELEEKYIIIKEEGDTNV